MYGFNIVEDDETHERAYYVNSVRFNRELWRACMEDELENLSFARAAYEQEVASLDKVIRACQSMMDGKAAFELPKNSRAFYRQVAAEVIALQRTARNTLDEINATIEDLTDKLED